MQTILQINKDDLRTIFQEFTEEKQNLPPIINQPDRIDLSEACNILGLRKSTIYRLTMSNSLPCARFGKRLVFSRKDLAAWIESRTIGTHIASDTLTKGAIKKLLK